MDRNSYTSLLVELSAPETAGFYVFICLYDAVSAQNKQNDTMSSE
jgi:hypothetical protein